jgi:DNA-binding Lrp family transcriptional regulator
MRAAKLRLLDEFQRDFPLCPRPYAEIGERLDLTEVEVIVTLRQLQARGCVSRVGATIVPGRVGAATLATMAVPDERLETVAELVNSYPEVNHNYEREHEFNLWFVVTASREARVQAVVREIERRARCGKVLELPMVEAYHIDLGFGLTAANAVGRRAPGSAPFPIAPASYALAVPELALLAALQEGVPLTARPYVEIGLRAGMSEDAVIAALARLLRERVIGRLGVIVRHRELGYRANAMVVWDVPNAEVRTVGSSMARADFVTLCYRRLRYLPHWPYNLYCMIHGTNRDAVAARIGELMERCGLERYPREVLFSRRCFRQRGARYVDEVTDGRYRPEHRESAAEWVSHC